MNAVKPFNSCYIPLWKCPFIRNKCFVCNTSNARTDNRRKKNVTHKTKQLTPNKESIVSSNNNPSIFTWLVWISIAEHRNTLTAEEKKFFFSKSVTFLRNTKSIHKQMKRIKLNWNKQNKTNTKKTTRDKMMRRRKSKNCCRPKWIMSVYRNEMNWTEFFEFEWCFVLYIMFTNAKIRYRL